MWFKKKREIDFYDYLFNYQANGINILEDKTVVMKDPIYEDYIRVRSDKMNPLQNQICQILFDRQIRLLDDNPEFQITHIQSSNINLDFNKEIIQHFENSIQVIFKVNKVSLESQLTDINGSILLMDNIKFLTSWSIIPGQIDYTTLTRINKICSNVIIPVDIQLQHDFKSLGKNRAYEQLGTMNFYLVVKQNLIPEEQREVTGVE